MDPRGLFRKTALEKRRSPERLDVPIQVVDPIGWWALSTFGVVLFGILIWSVLGSISNRIEGRGILSRGTYFEVKADAGGQVRSVAVRIDDRVRPEAALADIDQPDIQNQRDSACENAAKLSAEAASLRANHDKNARSWSQQIRRHRVNLAAREQERAKLEGDRADTKLNAPRVVEEKLADVNETIAQLRSQIDSLGATRRASEQSVSEIERQALQANNECEDVADKQQRLQRIASQVDGQIVKVLVKPEDRVEAGDPLIHIVQPWPDQRLRARFLTSTEHNIRPGMRVEVSPSGDEFARERFGFIRGEVISAVRVTDPAELRRHLAFDLKAGKFISEGKGYYSVLALLEPADTFSGYDWSSSDGPKQPLQSEGDLSVNVVTEPERPIVKLIPALKKLFTG